jgi:hypothetical protein
MKVAQPYIELQDEMITASAACRRSLILIRGGRRKTIMLWTILVVLMILWLLGLIGGIGGGLVHLLLVLAVIVLIFQLLSGRRTVV